MLVTMLCAETRPMLKLNKLQIYTHVLLPHGCCQPNGIYMWMVMILKNKMALVKPLTKWENSRLVDLVHQYFEDATNLINYTDELTLQHLNTPDPTKYTST